MAESKDWKRIQSLNLQIFEYELECCEPTSNLEYPFSLEGIKYFRTAAAQEDGHHGIIAEVEGEIVGYAILKEIAQEDLTHRVDVKQIQLHTLSVDESFRDKGIGSELVDFCVKFSGELGFNRMKVVAYAPNDRARHLYRKKGFSELEVTYELEL